MWSGFLGRQARQLSPVRRVCHDRPGNYEGRRAIQGHRQTFKTLINGEGNANRVCLPPQVGRAGIFDGALTSKQMTHGWVGHDGPSCRHSYCSVQNT